MFYKTNIQTENATFTVETDNNPSLSTYHRLIVRQLFPTNPPKRLIISQLQNYYLKDYSLRLKMKVAAIFDMFSSGNKERDFEKKEN